MECVNSLTIQKKRRLEDVGTWSSCQPKRVCGGAGVFDQMMVCPMEMLWSVDATPQHQQQHQQQQQMATAKTYTTVASLLDGSMRYKVWSCSIDDEWETDFVDKHNVVVYPIQACPRCLSGEPGHINHIMGY